MTSRLIAFLAACVMLAACQTSGEIGETGASREPATTVTLTPPPTFTTAPTGTPNPTSTMTKTPYPPTPESQRQPDIFSGPIAKDLLFSGDPNCHLPCWYGLRTGESHVEEIQNKLRQALGLPKGFVFIMGENPQLLGTNAGYINFDWQGDQAESNHLFGIQTYFNPKTDVLGRFQVSTTVPVFLQRNTPQRVIRELGVPYGVWVNFQVTEVVNVASLSAIFLFDTKDQNRIAVFWSAAIPVQLTPRVAKWCLAGQAQQRDDYFLLRVSARLDPDSTTPSDSYYEPLQDVFGITPEVLYQLVLQVNNTCLLHKY